MITKKPKKKFLYSIMVVAFCFSDCASKTKNKTTDPQAVPTAKAQTVPTTKAQTAGSTSGNQNSSPSSSTSDSTSPLADLVAIDVSPGSATIALGLTQKFSATGTAVDGTTRDVTSDVMWISSSRDTATIDYHGLAEGKAAGTVQITATKGDLTSTVNLTIISTEASPTNAAVSVAFTDSDPVGGMIEGDLAISKASQEDDLTHYVVYWGSNSTTKLSTTAITTLAKTAAHLTYSFTAHTVKPEAATHLLVFTKNAAGEMSTGVSVAITDLGPPTNAAISVAFTDTDFDGSQLTGSVTITKAASESDVTHYVLYWGTDATTKQSGTPITSVAKTGANLIYNLAANTVKPAAASHFLVFTKNDDGEMGTGASIAITDLGVPSHTAASVAFTDVDFDGSQLSGNVLITKSVDESDITHYVLYWGSNSTTKQSGTAITTAVKTGANITYNFSANTAKPAAATHLLVFTKNADGEMSTGISVAITDLGVPVNAATSAAFTDTDLDATQVDGDVEISIAGDESDITHYVLYWGSNTTTKQSSTPIATIAKTGSNLTYNFAPNTAKPGAANHLLVFTKNADGEMATGVSVAIIDLGVPTNAAVSVGFTDTDLDGSQVAGTVSITMASSETDVTHYVLYWGSDATTKQSGTSITSVAKTGANLSYNVAANTSKPASASHFLVFTKNADGEMGTGVSVAITDLGVPTHAAASVAFTDGDLDGSQISGDVTITKAANESDVTHYVLYWGSNSTTKQSGTAIITAAKTGANITYNFAADTAKPGAATHLLVFTKNADGEMNTGVNVAITDLGVPTHTAASVAFTDGDLDGSQISGDVTITKAADESDVTHYVLYWGSSTTAKQSGTAITTATKTGANITYNFAANTAKPGAATHLLVFTKNADGEMSTGVNLAITDLGVPTHAAASVAFTDTDTDSGQLAGDVTITKSANESDVTHYVLYWGSSTTSKQSATPITTAAKTGSNIIYNFGANTAKPGAATHLLVFTKNADGEMATGVNVAITDVTAGGGTITVTAPASGAPYSTGANVTITWTSSGVSGNVKIEYLLGSLGAQTPFTIVSATANDGSYVWPSDADCYPCQIKVSSVDTPSVNNFSPFAFAVVSE